LNNELHLVLYALIKTKQREALENGENQTLPPRQTQPHLSEAVFDALEATLANRFRSRSRYLGISRLTCLGLLVGKQKVWPRLVVRVDALEDIQFFAFRDESDQILVVV
jgi:hypothetical protein